MRVWVCDAVERGMKKFILNSIMSDKLKKGHGQRGSLVPNKTNCNLELD